MEGRKKSGSSSFTTDLFGSKDSPASSSTGIFGSKDSPASSSTGIFGSIFAPSPMVLGRESVRSETVEKKQDPASPVWNTKTGPPENISQASVGENHSAPTRDMGSYYHEEKVQPCHLSSSIYYGGQDVYSYPQNNQSSVHTTFNRDSGEDDSGCASRGNWWQGSLYY